MDLPVFSFQKELYAMNACFLQIGGFYLFNLIRVSYAKLYNTKVCIYLTFLSQSLCGTLKSQIKIPPSEKKLSS